MRISQKLIAGFVIVVTPTIVVSIFAVISIDTQIQEFGQFHTPALYLIQQSANQTLEAVQESFAYIASRQEIERDEFLRWAQRYVLTHEEFEKVANLDQAEEKREKELFERIKSGQKDLAEKAKEMFAEFESKGSISEKTFQNYENTIDILFTDFREMISMEKEEVNQSQQRALETIARGHNSVNLAGVLCLGLAIFLGLFMAHGIAKPISKLTVATVELGAGKWDHQLAINSNDEVGQLAYSFNKMANKMANNLRDRTLDTARPYGSAAEPSMRDKLVLFEKKIIIDALSRTNGVKNKAAALLQVDPRNFPYLLRKHDLYENFQPNDRT